MSGGHRAVMLLPLLLLALALGGRSSAAAGAGYGWLKGTTWHWNNWRFVIFRDDNIFLAPDDQCARERCRWSADTEHVYIDWGTAGQHVVTASAMQAVAGTTLSGKRVRDGEAIKAVYVLPIRGVPPPRLEQFYVYKQVCSSVIFVPSVATPHSAAPRWVPHVQATEAGKTQSMMLSGIPGCERVSLSKLNDDYCDCGLDEPQTSACSGLESTTAGAGRQTLVR